MMTHSLTYDRAPLRVYWETTGACDLACRHCRAEAVPVADPAELSTEEGQKLLAELAGFGAPLPHLVLTGGDPLKRDDLFDLIARARELGFGVSVAPSATPLLTRDAIFRLEDAGVDAISLSLDGSCPERHDAIRGIEGTYRRTLEAAAAAREVGLPFQVNTLVCSETAADLPAIHADVVAIGAARWSLFFLVTVGRGTVLEPLSPEATEAVLVWIARLGAARPARPGQRPLVITTTEAPQIRRVVAEMAANAQRVSHEGARGGEEGRREPGHEGERPAEKKHGGARHAAGIRDGNGILFISNTGEICPSGFLEVSTGNVRRDPIVDVYRAAPLFRALRDPDGFGGRCGACEHRYPCGGSRARAFSASGDPLAEDPSCAHVPAEETRAAASSIRASSAGPSPTPP